MKKIILGIFLMFSFSFGETQREKDGLHIENIFFESIETKKEHTDWLEEGQNKMKLSLFNKSFSEKQLINFLLLTKKRADKNYLALSMAISLIMDYKIEIDLIKKQKNKCE